MHGPNVTNLGVAFSDCWAKKPHPGSCCHHGRKMVSFLFGWWFSPRNNCVVFHTLYTLNKQGPFVHCSFDDDDDDDDNNRFDDDKPLLKIMVGGKLVSTDLFYLKKRRSSTFRQTTNKNNKPSQDKTIQDEAESVQTIDSTWPRRKPPHLDKDLHLRSPFGSKVSLFNPTPSFFWSGRGRTYQACWMKDALPFQGPKNQLRKCRGRQVDLTWADQSCKTC